ncbi:MAG: anaerobic ribonucleoside-triphosphate reductase activating protein [Deltaproteobacteria bacterium]|nr:anaerobic ribonucleoside-triphosphate reductase activating protein [Deltaproteobacteria bacterium]
MGGLNKVSTLDYPKGVSAVVFTQGCNFFCPYCHNPDLVRPFGTLMDEDGVLEFLKTRVKLLDGVVISGGEPTVVADLPEFILKVKGFGYKVKLDTNGSRPETIKDLLERHLVDYVALDIKADPRAYPPELGPPEETERVMETINLLKRLGRPHEFRTTAAAPFVNDDSVEAIARAATGDAPLYLQKFKPQTVFTPGFMANHPDQPGPEDLYRFRDIARHHLPAFIR